MVKSLYRLRPWLLVPEVATHLSIAFGEDITEADVLRLGLDEQLVLSVNLVNGAPGRLAKRTPARDVGSTDFQYRISDNEVLVPVNARPLGRDRTSGVWDLPLVGGERRVVENRYQALLGSGIRIRYEGDETLFSRTDGTWFVLDVPFDVPFDEQELPTPIDLPEDAVLVVRTTALDALKARIRGDLPSPVKKLGPREKTSLLLIIATLAELAKLDVSDTAKASKALERAMTTALGRRRDRRTIKGFLDEIPDALEKTDEEA